MEPARSRPAPPVTYRQLSSLVGAQSGSQNQDSYSRQPSEQKPSSDNSFNSLQYLHLSIIYTPRWRDRSAFIPRIALLAMLSGRDFA
jgi:hypothetical protein